MLASELSCLVVQCRLLSGGKLRPVLELAAVTLRTLATKMIVVAEISPLLLLN